MMRVAQTVRTQQMQPYLEGSSFDKQIVPYVCLFAVLLLMVWLCVYTIGMAQRGGACSWKSLQN